MGGEFPGHFRVLGVGWLGLAPLVCFGVTAASSLRMSSRGVLLWSVSLTAPVQ